ncbi:MAG: hypothetical protein AAFY84_09160 [Pseudomonadota bacterium]
MISVKSALLYVVLTLSVAGCTTHTQNTSGAEYLHRAEISGIQLDDEFKAAANIEPLLTFPARIGFAKVENGRMVDVPPKEYLAFEQAVGNENPNEFVPIDPFYADLFGEANQATGRRRLIRQLRFAGARQHLDAIYVYEVSGLSAQHSNQLGLVNFTILGGFLAPSANVETVAAAKGILFDVRNYYPYGQITTSSEGKMALASFNNGRRKQRELDDHKLASIQSLAVETAEMLSTLEKDLIDSRASHHLSMEAKTNGPGAGQITQ